MKSFFRELSLFFFKQVWACLFGICMLGLIGLTYLIDLDSLGIQRYDVLFLGAVTIQLLLMAFRLETPEETKIIFLFHIVATCMELFKTSSVIGAWHYPDETLFRIGNVPLFAGFMYSAVGSYFARMWRLFDFKFTRYPKFWWTVVLAAFIYLNFYSHHFMVDLRYALFVFVGVLYGRCWLAYTIDTKERRVPILLFFLAIAVGIWIAENIGTYCQVWLYPHQTETWSMVGPDKIAAWFLLMIISFVMVAGVNKRK